MFNENERKKGPKWDFRSRRPILGQPPRVKGYQSMTILNATEARAKLYSLIDEAASTHQPIVITGKRGNAVLVFRRGLEFHC